jgi:hypothetical protein
VRLTPAKVMLLLEYPDQQSLDPANNCKP